MLRARCGRWGRFARVNKSGGRERARQAALSTSVVQVGARAHRRAARFTMRSLRESSRPLAQVLQVFGRWGRFVRVNKSGGRERARQSALSTSDV